MTGLHVNRRLAELKGIGTGPGRVLFWIGCAVFAASFLGGGAYRILAARGDPVLVHFSNLGDAFAARGDAQRAIESYKGVLKLRPAYPQIEFNLANSLASEGRIEEAEQHYRQALRLNPSFAEAHYNLANLLAGQNLFDSAEDHYSQATTLRPAYAEAYYNWGVWLARRGKTEEAVKRLEEAIRVRPDYTEAYFSLGLVLSQTRRRGAAIRVLTQGRRFAPEHVNLSDTLAWLLATASEPDLRDGTKAVELAERTCASSGRSNPQHLDTLAAAYAESARFEEAAQTAALAETLARGSGNETLARAITGRLALYRSRTPYREN